MRPVRADEGFSLLEVLFASFIAFFVLTALFGVLVMSATEGRVANVDTIATNLAQLSVEQARSLPYEQVGLVGGGTGTQPLGSLLSSETTTFQGISFNVRRDVVWVADPLNPGGEGHDYKRLTVLVRNWSGGGTARIVTFIGDQTIQVLPGPRVEFTTKPTLVRPPNPVLFLKNVGGSMQSAVWDGLTRDGSLGAPSIQASASVDGTSGTIIRIEFQAGNTVIGTPWTGTPVPWVSSYPETPQLIDLTSKDASNNDLFTEGTNIIKVVATGNNLGTGTDMIIVTVDNSAGDFKSTDALTAGPPDKNADVYNGGLKLSWPVPFDGPSDPVPYYDITLRPYGSTLTTYSMAYLGESGTYVLGPTPPSSVSTLTPFSAVTIGLQTRSIRGLRGTRTLSVSNAVVPPSVRGSVYNQAPDKHSAAKYRIDLVAGAPAANLALALGAPTGTWYYDVYSMDAAGYVYPGTGDLPATAYLETSNKTTPGLIQFEPKDNNCNKYFQVEARLMVGVTLKKRIRGNVVGPQPLAGPPKFLTSADLRIPGVTP